MMYMANPSHYIFYREYENEPKYKSVRTYFSKKSDGALAQNYNLAVDLRYFCCESFSWYCTVVKV